MGQILLHKGQHKPLGRLQPAVQVNAGDQRLKGIAHHRGPLPAAGLLLAMTQQQLLAQLYLLGKFKQALFAHQARANSGQVALRQVELMKDMIRHNDGKHRVSQELHPLVALYFLPAFIGVGGMNQRTLQKRFIVKTITDSLLQSLHGHNCTLFYLDIIYSASAVSTASWLSISPMILFSQQLMACRMAL